MREVECPRCKTYPKHGSCVCDEHLVKELDDRLQLYEKVIMALALELQDTDPFDCNECKHAPNKLTCDAVMCAEARVEAMMKHMKEQDED